MGFEELYTKHRMADYIINGLAKVGEYSYGMPRILHWGEKSRVVIGRYCSIADDVKILLGGNHRLDWITTYPFSAPQLNELWPEAKDITGHPATKGDVIIGNDVWIGHGATILSGVNIGNGAVIGSMAVVAKDVRPYAVVVGNPSKEIKRRFSDSDVEFLQNLQWWNWSEEKIRDNVSILCSLNIEELKKI